MPASGCLARLKRAMRLPRPWSLTATAVPLFAAFALARHAPSFSAGRWLLALLAAALLQLCVNLLNTWGDAASGVDRTPGAVCTVPYLIRGEVTARGVLGYAAFLFLAAGACALPLFAVPSGHGWSPNVPLLVIAGCGVLGALNYTTLLAFKYRGLGVPFVFLLMGPLEVLGGIAAAAPGEAAAVCAHRALAAVTAASLPVGALVAAIMLGNDMRDLASDRAAGIRTTAGVLRAKGSLALFALLHATPHLAALILFVAQGLRVAALAPLLAAPLTFMTLHRAAGAFRRNPAAPDWRALEGESAALHFLLGVLWCVALWGSGCGA